MKYLMTLLLIGTILIFTTCSNDDDGSDFLIVGKWKLMASEQFETEINYMDYSEDNIIYNFQDDGKLIISSNEDSGYFNGAFNYEFKYDYLSPIPMDGESKQWLVIIEGQRSEFSEEGDTMILSTAYVDGPTLYFERLR